MAIPPEATLTVKRGSFLYKTAANEATWTRLRSPTGLKVRHTNYCEPQFNIWKIEFDSGVTLTQTDQKHRITCKLKLILKPPGIKIEGEQLSVEAECVEIGIPAFYPYDSCADKQKAVEHAKKNLPLAQLDKTITAGAVVKLENICNHHNSRWEEMIVAQIEKGYVSWVTAQSNGSAGSDRTNRPGPSSGSGPAQTTNGRVFFPGPAQATNSLTVRPGHRSLGGVYMATAADQRALEKELNAHAAATAEAEERSLQAWGLRRQMMVSNAVLAASAECDRQMVAAMAEQRARAVEMERRIRAKWRV